MEQLHLNVHSISSANCEICLFAKQTRTTFPLSKNVSSQPFDLLHCDVWGPYRTPTHGKCHYFLTIVDDYTKCIWVFLFSSKAQVPTLIVEFINLVRNQFNRQLKVLRSDNGTEFVNQKLHFFLSASGIIHQTYCIDTPQQNGVVERAHHVV